MLSFAHKRCFSAEEYHRMGESGIFRENEQVELIKGEIFRMSPIGTDHAACVDRLNRILHLTLGESWIIRVQNPVSVSGDSEPEPDISVVKFHPQFYARHHPEPKDIGMIIEVSDTSLEYDRQIKLPLYAKSGISEVWIVNLKEGCVEIHSSPGEHGYELCRKHYRGSQLRSPSFPDLKLSTEDLLGTYLRMSQHSST